MNRIAFRPRRRRRPDSRIRCRRSATVSVATVSGASPSRPSITALWLPWPMPVAPSEPNSSARIAPTRSSRPSVSSRRAKVSAARIGPTVCELDGPIPILNRSNALIAIRPPPGAPPAGRERDHTPESAGRARPPAGGRARHALIAQMVEHMHHCEQLVIKPGDPVGRIEHVHLHQSGGRAPDRSARSVAKRPRPA